MLELPELFNRVGEMVTIPNAPRDILQPQRMTLTLRVKKVYRRYDEWWVMLAARDDQSGFAVHMAVDSFEEVVPDNQKAIYSEIAMDGWRRLDAFWDPM